MKPSSIISLIKKETPLLCLSDEDRKKDNDFLNAYFAILYTIKAINLQQKFEELEPIISEIELLIENIELQENKQRVVIDIFSLIFLQRKTIDNNLASSFVCHILTAQSVLTILLTSCDDSFLKYLQSGLTQIQVGQQLATSSSSNANTMMISLSEILKSTKNQLYEALMKEDITVAEHYAQLSEKNRMLFNCFVTVNSLRDKMNKLNFKYKSKINENNEGENKSYFENEKKELIFNLLRNNNKDLSENDREKTFIGELEEASLSFDKGFLLFQKISENTKNEYIKILIDNSSNIESHNNRGLERYKFNHIKPFKLYKIYSKSKFEKILLKLERNNLKEWAFPTLVLNNKDEYNSEKSLKIFKGFFEYLDLMIPPLLNGNTIKDVLIKSADEMIDELLFKNEFEQAEQIAKRMKIDVQVRVLSNLKYSKNCYERYCENSIPLMNTISLFENWKLDHSTSLDKTTNSEIVSKLLKLNFIYRKFIINKELNFDLSTINFNDELLINRENKNYYKIKENEDVIINDIFYQDGFQVDEAILKETYLKNNKEMFIDLCFRAKSEKIVEKVIDENLKDDTIEKLCEMVDVIPVSLNFRKKYQFLRETRKFISINNLEQAFTNLLRDKKYRLASQLFKHFTFSSGNNNEILFNKIIRKILKERRSNYYNSSADIGIIIVSPLLKEEISDHFDQKKIDNQTDFFKQKIPENWIFINDSINPIEKSIIANLRDTENAINILAKFGMFVDCDNSILDHFNQSVIQNIKYSFIEKIENLRKLSTKFINVFKNPFLLINFLTQNLNTCILSFIKIETIDNEINLCFYLRKIIFLIKSIKNKENNNNTKFNKLEYKKLKSLYLFSSKYFFLKYSFSYNLGNINDLINFCISKGCYSLAKRIYECYYYIEFNEKNQIFNKNYDVNYLNNKSNASDKYKIKNTFYDEAFELFFQQFKLSLFDENPIYPIIENENKLNKLDQEKSEKFAYHASKFSEYDSDLISKLRNEMIKSNQNLSENYILNISSNYNYAQQYINKIINGMKPIPSERANKVFTFFDKYSDIEASMKFYKQDFENSFHILENNLIKENNKNEIIEITKDYMNLAEKGFMSMFETAISTSKLQVFLASLQKYDHRFLCIQEMNNSSTKEFNYSYFLKKNLYDQIDSAKSPFLKMTISQIIGDNYTTAQIALTVYADRPNLMLLDLAQKSLEEIVTHTKNTQNVNNNNFEENKTTSKIELTLKKIDLQRRFVVFCTEKKLDGFETLNLAAGDVSIVNIVVLLFRQNEFSLSLDILNSLCQKGDLVKNIIEKTAFALINDGIESIQSFVHFIQNAIKEEDFNKIFYLFLNCLVGPPFYELDSMKKLVYDIITNDVFKAKILLELGDLESSANLSISKSIFELLPMIAKASFRQSNMSVYWKCMKAIECNNLNKKL